MIIHPISPVWDENSKILILGSFPSVKSREQGFFYGHPQNRFWRVVSSVIGCTVPVGIEEKRSMLLENSIAVWDVIASCEIVGSADSTITDVVPNDISHIVSSSRISAIFTNGKKSDSLYRKYIEKTVGIKATCLPSTSPANAAWTFDKLIEGWSVLKENL